MIPEASISSLHLLSKFFQLRFLHSMDLVYAATDLIVSISGAMICSEVLAAGKPCILVHIIKLKLFPFSCSTSDARTFPFITLEEEIRAVTHDVIASAEKTSISSMRMAFYEIIKKHRVRPVGFLPCAIFGCSVATCTGLLMYGDGIECAAESLPAAPSIASLGRGIQSLHQASKAEKQTENSMIQKSIESLVYKFKKVSFS
ncbi:hypothetical protein T459_12247 [Capsicum annuum]|uniref:Glycosyl transferase family 28 C-terminal domain-containing protein n=1 Tax=Capsicum annuum TaxID=4072 RepID=A0A2G2ZPD9_CAPAN|nr:hypothetical protein T459_12247 [Capsicum annuum]